MHDFSLWLRRSGFLDSLLCLAVFESVHVALAVDEWPECGPI